LDQERLGETRDTDEERVAAAEERGQHAIHHVVLSYDALPDLRAEVADRR
jgi:hypothetical protein